MFEPEAGGPAWLDPSDPDPDRRAALRAWLTLQRESALRPTDMVRALRAGHSPAALLRARATGADAETRLERARRLGVCVVPFGFPAYPRRLERLSDAPPVLVVRGDPAVLSERCVALVGARAPTRYGRRVARELAAGLARAGVVLVSGLARGIDAEAHEAALAAGGLSVAVQACGIDRVAPAGHAELAARIGDAGAVVTEFAAGTPPLPHHFPLRNRIISGLSEAVVVVEARLRSGSLVTARHAGDQGVDVFAVPGPVDSPTSAGPLRLLRDGAGLVARAEDVLEQLRPPLQPGLATVAARRGQPDGVAREILRVLEAGPASRDELSRALAAAPESLALPLVELELAGHVEREPGGRLRKLP